VLPAWKPDTRRHPASGPMQFAFIKTFSIQELDTGLKTGTQGNEQPHFFARQTLVALGSLVDVGKFTRAILQVEDGTEKMVVDIIKHNGVLIRSLPDSGDPMVVVRVAHHTTSDPNGQDPMTKEYEEAIRKSMPRSQAYYICCRNKEEMGILKNHFQSNHSKLRSQFWKQIKKSVAPGLFQIPGSYTSFLSPLYLADCLPGAPPDPCLNCGRPGTKRCSKCKVAKYCRAECQTEHWQEHKGTCNKYKVSSNGASSGETKAVGASSRTGRSKEDIDSCIEATESMTELFIKAAGPSARAASSSARAVGPSSRVFGPCPRTTGQSLGAAGPYPRAVGPCPRTAGSSEKTAHQFTGDADQSTEDAAKQFTGDAADQSIDVADQSTGGAACQSASISDKSTGDADQSTRDADHSTADADHSTADADQSTGDADQSIGDNVKST